MKIYELTNLRIPKPRKKPKNMELEKYIYKSKEDNLRVVTNKYNKKKKGDISLIPQGLKICNFNTFMTRKKEIKTLENFIKYFNNYMKQFLKKDEILLETFMIKKGKERFRKTFSQIIDIIEENNFQYKKIIMFYFDEVLKCFNIDKKKNKKLYNKAYNESFFGIWEYDKNKLGLRCHMDNFIIGGDEVDLNGPLVTITLGTDFYYDFRPVFYDQHVLKNELKPFRLKIHDRQVVIMDGELRSAWQHCVPYGYIKNRKITLKFKLPCLHKYNKIHNNFLNIDFTTSFKN